MRLIIFILIFSSLYAQSQTHEIGMGTSYINTNNGIENDKITRDSILIEDYTQKYSINIVNFNPYYRYHFNNNITVSAEFFLAINKYPYSTKGVYINSTESYYDDIKWNRYGYRLKIGYEYPLKCMRIGINGSFEHYVSPKYNVNFSTDLVQRSGYITTILGNIKMPTLQSFEIGLHPEIAVVIAKHLKIGVLFRLGLNMSYLNDKEKIYEYYKYNNGVFDYFSTIKTNVNSKRVLLNDDFEFRISYVFKTKK